MNQFSTLAFVTIFWGGSGWGISWWPSSHRATLCPIFGGLEPGLGLGALKRSTPRAGGHSASLIDLIAQPCSTASSCHCHPGVLSPDVQGDGPASLVTSRAEQSVPSSTSLPPPCPNFANNPLSNHFPFKPEISWSHLLHANPSP